MTVAPATDLEAPGADARVPDLDATATLRSLQATVTARRREEVDDLLLCLHWADLHGSDPRRDPAGPGRGFDAHGEYGGDRLTLLGGEGTPRVRELSVPELGIARGVHPIAARKVLADALDLRHRLPRTFAHVVALRAEPWVARRAAAISRHLAADVVDVVDAAVSAAITGLSPSRVEMITQAAVVEADPVAHRARVEAERTRRHVSLTRSDETGLRSVIARVTAGDAAWIDATVHRVAEILASHPDHPDLHDAEIGVRRSAALGWLARPADLLTLLLIHTDDQTEDPEPSRAHAEPPATATATATGSGSVSPASRAAPPIDVEALGELLAHVDLTITPVVDLSDHVAVDAYEYPQGLRERIHLTRPADAFPHATRVSRHLDIDHPRAWRDPDDTHDPGPAGQTGTHNAQPLSRTGHRAKTHLGYTVTRIHTGAGPPAHLWRTPHGLHRLVDHSGTHDLTDHQVRELLNRAEWTDGDT